MFQSGQTLAFNCPPITALAALGYICDRPGLHAGLFRACSFVPLQLTRPAVCVFAVMIEHSVPLGGSRLSTYQCAITRPRTPDERISPIVIFSGRFIRPIEERDAGQVENHPKVGRQGDAPPFVEGGSPGARVRAIQNGGLGSG